MAKIKVGQDSGNIVVTVAGETRKDYKVTGGVITAAKADAAHLLSVIPGATLAPGSSLDDDDAEDVGVYVEDAPDLPTPAEVADAAAPADAGPTPRRGR